MYRAGASVRSIADHATASGHPLHRDAAHRHLKSHVAPRDDLDRDTPQDRDAGLLVATLVAGSLSDWPSRLAQAAVGLRAEGLHEAADVLLAASDPPSSTRAALIAAAGTPASLVVQGRVLSMALRRALANEHVAATRAIACEVRELGDDDLAAALDDLADAVDAGTTPEERSSEVQSRALAAAHRITDENDRDLALSEYGRAYGDVQPWLDSYRARLPATQDYPGGP